MKNYNDNLEKILTAVFGILGMFAVLINLNIKGYDIGNILDAIKDMAGLVVVITVFLVTSKLFRREKQLDFPKIFEEDLKEWIAQNNYLMSAELEATGTGKFSRRFCAMVKDHSNFVTEKKLAKDANHHEKAVFVYLPKEESEKKFEFRFNETTFERQETYIKKNDAVVAIPAKAKSNVDLNAILEQFSKRINDKFNHLFIDAKVEKQEKAIIVTYEKLDETKENARKLIDLIEFVKTMVLALA